MQKHLRIISLLAFSATLWQSAPVVAQGVLDPSFTPTVLKRAAQLGDYPVRAMLQQPDGKVLVSGNYDFVDNQVTSRLRRLNADGTPDAAFAAQTGTGPDPAGLVVALALQSTGKILAGCASMNYYNQTPTGNLVRLTPAGAVDATFNAGGSGFRNDATVSNYANNIRSLAVQPDDKILVGGFLGSYNLRPIANLVRLNANGTIDAGFNVGSGGFTSTGSGANSGIPETMLVQPDGKILVGGSFGAVGGTPAYNLVRLNANGTIDNTFLSSGTNGSVRSIVRQPDGKLLLGGLFTQVNGQASGGLTRLNADGTRDTGFVAGVLNANGGIYKVRLRADGSIVASGTFTSYNSTPRGGVASVSGTGALDTNFGPASGTNNLVYDVLDLTNGQTLAGGIFTTFGGTARTGLVRLNGTASQVDATYNPVMEFRGTVNQLTPLANGELLVEGDFSNFNGVSVAASGSDGLHVLNSNGSYNRFVPFTNAGSSYRFPQPDGRIYLFTINGFSPTATLTRCLVTGAPDPAFAAVTVADATAYFLINLTILPGGDLLLTGSFNAVNGQARPNMARLTPSGTLDVTFNPSSTPWQAFATDNVRVVGIQPNGQPVMYWQEATRSHVTRLSATTGDIDNSFSVVTNVYNHFSAYMQPTGQVLLSGIAVLNGQPISGGMVRLTASGQEDFSFHSTLTLTVFAIQSDGSLLGMDAALTPSFAFRRFSSNGALDTSFPTVSAPTGIYTGSTASVTLQPQDGKILLYGGFSSVNGQSRIGLARLTNTLLATRPAFAATPEVEVFPNPAQQQVTLQLPAVAVSPIAQPVTLLDMQGRTVRRFTLPARQAAATFSLADVAAGIYFLQASTSQGPARQRVVVTH